MTIADTIFQHVKALPQDQALEVLHFVEFLESKSVTIIEPNTNETMLSFLQRLPVSQRSDMEINADFQSLRNEWDSNEAVSRCL